MNIMYVKVQGWATGGGPGDQKQKITSTQLISIMCYRIMPHASSSQHFQIPSCLLAPWDLKCLFFTDPEDVFNRRNLMGGVKDVVTSMTCLLYKCCFFICLASFTSILILPGVFTAITASYSVGRAVH